MTDQTNEPSVDEAALKKAQAEAEKAQKKQQKEAEAAQAKAKKAEELAAKKAQKAEADKEAAAAKAQAKEAAVAKRKQESEAKAAAKAQAKEDAKKAKEDARMPMQNDIRMPKPDTDCGKAWAVFNKVSNQRGSVASIGESMILAKEEGINEATIRTQYARWRKFHGVSGRVENPTKVSTETAPAAE